MRRRAEQMEEVRQRIIEAAVELHGSVGPASTTISALARRAGVTRMTIYRHFTDEEAIFAACSEHWLSGQQPPDPASWAQLEDPMERLHAGLTDLYRFYQDGADMLSRIYRDKAAIPARHRAGIEERDRSLQDLLLAPFPEDQRLRAVVTLATSFWTWRSLCVEQGLANPDAVDTMTAFARSVVGPDLRRISAAPS